MPARENVTTSAQITATAREVDFVTRFGDNREALRNILGIMRPIRKTPGTKLVAYKASVDGTLNGGKTVAEGDEMFEIFVGSQSAIDQTIISGVIAVFCRFK